MTVLHVLRIPNWHPTPLNQLLKNRWEASRLKKADRDMVWAYAREKKIPRPDGKRRVHLTIILKPKQRGADPDAYQKSLGDALVRAGLLKDDNARHVEWAPALYERGTLKAWGSRIVLEDL